MTRVKGLDVSYWNERVDWRKVYDAGYRFVYVKATEGQAYQDPTFAANWRDAKQAGLLRGAYHFYHPAMDAETQAALFIRQVQATKDIGELPPALDLEVTDQKPNSILLAGVKIWVERIREALGKAPILYSSYYFLKDHVSLYGKPPSWASEFSVWIADYVSPCDLPAQPHLPPGWTRWAFWQYTKSGAIPGIRGKVDINCFNGNLEALHRFASGDAAPAKLVRYTVQEGDTLTGVASRFGISLESLVAANPHLLTRGMTLQVPAAAAEETGGESSAGTPPSETRYTVRPGDTLAGIAARHHTTVEAIVAANHLANPDVIHVGQELVIPS